MAGFDLSVVSEKLGPLPAWQWALIGGGGLLVVSKLRHVISPPASNPAQQMQLNPGLFPSPLGGSTDPTAAGTVIPTTPGATPANGGLPVLSTSDASGTTQYAPATFGETLGSLIGTGGLMGFLNGLRNTPDQASLTLPGGTSLNFSNGVSTFGGGQGTSLIAPDQTAAQWAGLSGLISSIGGGIQHLQPGESWYNPLTGASGTPYTPPAVVTAGAGAPAVTAPPVVTAAPPVAAPPANPQCNSGNFSCIRYACPPGNFSCARSVAPWWNGSRIGGWN